MNRDVILASASPRRKELLSYLFADFQILPADIDEQQLSGEDAISLVRRLALQKAEVIAKQNRDSLVLGADVVVVLGEEVLGKPTDKEDACSMLTKLSNKESQVIGGIALRCINSETELVNHSVTNVTFGEVSPEEIQAYVDTGEPMDKAGAYAIQGRAGRFIKSISGSYTNVVGLDLFLLNTMLKQT